MEENKSTSGGQKKGTFLIILSILFIAGAIFTLLPLHLADDKCFLGYSASCPFTPISSLILLAVGFYLIIIRKKQLTTK